MNSLLCLPDEIISAICDHVHPGSVLAFASVCKRVYACSDKTLSGCAETHGRLHLLHDRHPLTLLNVLREVVNDPRHACYIRDIELWEFRESFSRWRTPIFTVGNPYVLDNTKRKNWLEEHHDFDYLGDANREPLYDQGELDHYRFLLVSLLRLPLSEAEKWVDQLVVGGDEALRALLMALSPNLQRLVFIQYDPWATSHASSRPPLKLFSSSLARVFQTLPKGMQWPCFSRLEIVQVGASSNLRHPHEVFYSSPREIAPLFLLPAIRQLRLSRIGYHREHGTPYEFAWTTSSSTCTDLTFSHCHIDASTMSSFILACNSLKRFRVVRSSGRACVIKALLQNSAGILTELQLDDRAQVSAADGGWPLDPMCMTSSGWNGSDEPRFEALRKIEIPVEELVDLRSESVHQGFRPLSELLGKSTLTVEAIRFQKLPPLARSKGMQDLIATLSDFVGSKSLQSTSQTALEPASLQSLCLSELEDWHDNFFILEQLLRRLRRVCSERGVYLHENRKPGSELGCMVCTEWAREDREELHTRPVVPPNTSEDGEVEAQEQYEDHDDEVRPPSVPWEDGAPPKALPTICDLPWQLVHFTQ